jgi:hypothetical protein
MKGLEVPEEISDSCVVRSDWSWKVLSLIKYIIQIFLIEKYHINCKFYAFRTKISGLVNAAQVRLNHL